MGKIKILTIIQNKSGSCYHRLEYPLSKINGQFIGENEVEVIFKQFKDTSIEEIKTFDIFTYDWNIADLSILDLGELQASGIKILYSLGDHFEFSELHPGYPDNLSRYAAKNRVITHLLASDAVITTTARLASHAIKYNENIAILPNFLNPEDFKVEKTKSDKLRIALLGSVSHYPDFLMFKQVLNRLAKNKDIVEKCQFVLAGYVKGDKYWEEIVSMFKKKKNIDFVVKDYIPLDNYMSLYSDIDVCMCPLEYTEFNICKSALRLMECAITNTLPIGSVLYSSKELKGIVVCETNEEYEQTILKLLDKDYYNQVLKYITETNLRDADYNLRIENTKAVIGALYNEDLSTKLDNIQIWNIKYKEEQPTEYKSILNQKREFPWRFEYNVFLDKLQEIKDSDKEYFGLLSWKFPRKTGLTKNILAKQLKKIKYNEYDFISLNREYWETTQKYLDFSYEQHSKLKELLEKALNNLNIPFTNFDLLSSNSTYTYSNFFLMKKEYMIDYVENWIIPTLEYLETDIWHEVNIDAEYKSGLSSEQLMESAGVEFYNYTTFVIERLIIFYVYNKDLKSKNIFNE